MNKDQVLHKAAEIIAEFEGLALKAYKCPAGVWTIGVGATGPGIKEGTIWTKDQALSRLETDIEERYAQMVAVLDRKSTRLNSSHIPLSRMPSSA